MTSDIRPTPQQPATPPTDAAPRYRSAAAARMARMPVATLRVWERRYRVTTPELTTSGQRLYSAADVRRLALIRHLTDLGHAIGALAALDQAQLQQVAATHFGNGAAATPGANRASPAAAAPTACGRGRRRLGPAPATAGAAAPTRTPVDLDRSVRHSGASRRCDRTLTRGRRAGPCTDAASRLARGPRCQRPLLQSLPKAVLYGFAADTLCADIAAAGVALLREPQNDTVLGQWLRVLADGASAFANAQPPSIPTYAAVPTRRWDDATLPDLASRATPIACECPRHIAELLLQLTRFETYSAECESRNAADAALHADLGRLAGMARAQLEAALKRVALAEGLRLPH